LCNKKKNWLRTFHQLLAPDANLIGLVAGEGQPGVQVHDLELGVPHHRAAGIGLHRQRLLGKRHAHGEHGACLCHRIPLSEQTYRDRNRLADIYGDGNMGGGLADI